MDETSPWIKLLIDFAMAVVSGGVAGLIAGWVLLNMQFRNQLALDDTSRIINILHAIEAAKDKSYMLAGTSVQNEDSIKDELWEQLLSVASEAQRLLSSRYKLLRAYLVLRIKLGRFNLHNPVLFAMELSEIESDIYAYVGTPRGVIGSIKYRWTQLKRIRRFFKSKLTEVQKELIIQGSKKGNPAHSYELIGNFTFNQAEEIIKVLNGLVEDGLFQDVGLDKYCLTSKGWKKAVQLRSGEYDSSIGFRAS